MLINAFALALVLCAVLCVFIAALVPASHKKGRIRLAGSLFIGAAFPVATSAQSLIERKLLPLLVGLIVGSFLAWIGWRKYRRDPQGKTPAAQIL